MIIVVDTNILISALITPNSQLARLLIHPRLDTKRISSHYLVAELSKHHTKIVKNAKRTSESLTEDLYSYLQYLILYDETIILPEHWQEAHRLTKDVDIDDIIFVALALQTGGLLWTCDKKLTEHLKVLGFDHVVNTAELSYLLNIG